jgi:predicted enzyme related to lactoylglutathione lyase
MNAIHWFEIPVRDMDRAVSFYETLLGAKLRRETFGGMPYAIFPYEAPGISGVLVEDRRRAPGAGTLVYLNANGKLDSILARAAAAKVTTIVPKTDIGKDGCIAVVIDSEGNAVGFNAEA